MELSSFEINGLALTLVVVLIALTILLQKIAAQKTQLYIENQKLKVDVQTLEKTFEHERKSFQINKEVMFDSFKSLASQALESNTQQFLNIAKSSLEKETKIAQLDLDFRHKSIQEMLKPLQDNIESYRKNLREIESSRVNAYTNIESELKRVAEGNLRLSKETTALKDALKKPHVRGRWGETQLLNCIEMSGMSKYCDVTLQDTMKDSEGKTLIPDMTVKMPGGHIVVVDAKTPTEAFFESLEADGDENRKAQIARHGKHVKEHVKQLGTKAYFESIPDSADFTVMFLPNESFLYAALETQPDIVEFALERKVLIATPPTLIGLLKVIRFGWNEEKLAENAKAISEAGQELHKRVCDFMEAYEEVGDHLDKAKKEYDKGYSRLKSRVLVQAKRLEKLGAKSNKKLPKGIHFDEDLALDAGMDVTRESVEHTMVDCELPDETPTQTESSV